MPTKKTKTILLSKDLYQYVSWKYPEVCSYLKEQYFSYSTELGEEFFNVSKEDRQKIKKTEKEFLNENL
jgi:hypothetical protein